MWIRLASILLLLLPTLSPAADTTAAVAFIYHRFGEDAYPSTSVKLAQFEAQLDHIERAGYRVWPLDQIANYLQRGEPLPDRTVAITVDDAYLSVYKEAFPRLKARGWPFTLFVSTDALDQRLPDFMSWDQVREMLRHGVSIGNHSASHDSLAKRRPGETVYAWRERVRADILKAQRRLKEELNAEPRLFAYPYGEYNTAVAGLVSELGFVAFGQQSGAIGLLSDRRALPRYPISTVYGRADDFALKAASLALPVKKIEPWDPEWHGPKAPRLTLTLAENEADLDRLACYSDGEPLAVTWEDRQALRFSIQAPKPLGAGRHRYNCTAPQREGNRFYWFSQPWLVVAR